MPKKQSLKRKRAPARPKKAPRSASQKQARKKKTLNTVKRVLDFGMSALTGDPSKIFKSLTGSGDYSTEIAGLPYDISANSLLNPKSTPPVPIMHNTNGAVRMTHREFLGTINTSVLFSSTPYILQPGDPKTFPYLSNIATRFQQYQFLGCAFELVTICGNAVSSTNAALGSQSMVIQYDVTQPSFTTLVNALNSFYAVSSVTSTDLMCAVECMPKETPYNVFYVRNTDSKYPFVGDQRLYDYGRLEVITVGSQAAYACSQLWVTYDVVLYKPILRDVGFHEEPPMELCPSTQVKGFSCVPPCACCVRKPLCG